MKSRIPLITALILAVFVITQTHSASAQSFNCPLDDSRVKIDPADPTSMDEVEAKVSLVFRTWPPYVDDFGSVVRRGNLFSVNIIIYVAKFEEFSLQINHTDKSSYSLGALDPGHYIFEVYVETIHGYEESWCIERVEFDVRSSENTVPEFSSNVASLLMLVLAVMSALLLKKSGKI